MNKLTTAQFTSVLPDWYKKYGCWNPGLRSLTTTLEKRISGKSLLNVNDLLDVLAWGGNHTSRYANIQDNNTDTYINENTSEAIQYAKRGIGCLPFAVFEGSTI